MRTQIIKILVKYRMSVREFNELLNKRKMKLGGSLLNSPQKIHEFIRKERELEREQKEFQQFMNEFKLS